MAREGMRSTVVGIGINLLLATIKGTAGVVGHSYALIADAIESSRRNRTPSSTSRQILEKSSGPATRAYSRDSSAPV